MFSYWHGPAGYHEGDSLPGDVEVPPRPSSKHIWDGEAWAEDLTAAKAEARVRVSTDAEAARQRFITPGSGKSMAYQEKAREAREFLDDPQAGEWDHDAARYPLIYAEVGSTAPNAQQVASVINQRFLFMRDIEAQIGGREAAAQKAIKDAASLAEIEAVLATLSWPMPTQG